MAKSTTKKGKQPDTSKAPSPAPSSSSASPSSSSSRGDDSDSDSDSSSSSSSSGRDSASPEPRQTQQRRVDPSSQKYTPPTGFKAVKVDKEHADLDWDALNDDKELELWAVRVPAGLKLKHLDGLTLTLPEKGVDPRQAVGHLTAKKADYNVFLSTSTVNNKRKRVEGTEDVEDTPGAKELQSLVPLVPRKREGNKLYQAPRPVTHTLVINRALPPSVLSASSAVLNEGHSTLIASQPSPVPGAILSAEELTDPSAAAKKRASVLGDKKRTQPEELLKFRLDLPGMKAVGGQGKYHNPPSPVEEAAPLEGDAEVGGEEDVEMAAPVAEEAADEDEKARKKREKKEKKEKKEKRKSKGGETEGESPKKKKVKQEE
ncbi:hypothetical protein JCM11641_003574 [Rhodosporidiobolus odoratus]